MLLWKNNSPLLIASFVVSILIVLTGCKKEQEKDIPKAKTKNLIGSLNKDSKKKSVQPTKQDRKWEEPDEQGAYVVERYGYPAETADKKQLLTLFRTADYAALDSLLRDFQNKFENDYRYEAYVMDAFSAFAIPDASLEHLFDEWLEKFPESFATFGVRANYFEAMAWEARGGEFIGETSSEQIAGMEKYYEIAEQEAARALDLNVKFLVGYDVLMSKAQSEGDRSENERLFQMVLRYCPNTFSLRSSYMVALTPRWGGSYREMEQFYRDCEKLTSVNPKLKLLGGYADWDKGSVLEIEKKPSQAIEFYTKAMSYGDHPLFMTYRGKAYAREEYFKKALRDLDRSIMLWPQSTEALKWRGYVNHSLNMVVQSRLDFELAYSLNPMDSYIQKWAKSYQIPPP